MTARALLREAAAELAREQQNVTVQLDHWSLLPATLTLEQAAVELSCGGGTVRALVREGKLRRVDVPRFLVSTASLRKLVEG